MLASDKRYQCALQGVKLLAHHSVGALVQALINWRTLVNDDIKRNYSQGSSSSLTIHGVAKRVSSTLCYSYLIHGQSLVTATRVLWMVQWLSETVRR